MIIKFTTVSPQHLARAISAMAEQETEMRRSGMNVHLHAGGSSVFVLKEAKSNGDEYYNVTFDVSEFFTDSDSTIEMKYLRPLFDALEVFPDK